MKTLRLWIRRILCRHSLAWVRNIYGDEINATRCRTVWRCDKCGKYVYDPQYFTREMAVKIYDPTK